MKSVLFRCHCIRRTFVTKWYLATKLGNYNGNGGFQWLSEKRIKPIKPLKIPTAAKIQRVQVEAICTPPRSPRSPGRSGGCSPRCSSRRFTPGSAPTAHSLWNHRVTFQEPGNCVCAGKGIRNGQWNAVILRFRSNSHWIQKRPLC